MSRELEDLVPEFRTAVRDLLDHCSASGYPMRQFFTLRTPFEQGKLWRQSRSTEQIQRELRKLRDRGAPFLAHCIESVGPQYGRHVTNAIPGFSWHQWGEAVDCFWLVDSNAEWSTRKKHNGKNGYRNYAELAKDLDLTAGGFWRSIKDWPHVQKRPEAHPGKLYLLSEIDQTMERRFGHDQP
ncbi:MAG: M15 family metallopeptidase [Gammaproteobacteria bacterium]